MADAANKSDARVKEGPGEDGGAPSSQLGLPFALVEKAVKVCTPEGVKASKSSMDLINASLSDFILQLARDANTLCVKEKKKYVTRQHVEQALKVLCPLTSTDGDREGPSNDDGDADTPAPPGAGGKRRKPAAKGGEEARRGRKAQGVSIADAEKATAPPQGKKRRKKLSAEEEEELAKEQEALIARAKAQQQGGI